ncbi:hypothetical protein PENSPDRAFT_759426 [Peniophora sp. CONT]|nr:hypothetical protein PENSPDRAFT_759426 [Peniophora sp. CONT]
MHMTSGAYLRLLYPPVMINTDNDDFIELPRELQVLILSRLEIRDLIAVAQVSHFLRNLVRSTPLLQYPIELLACGMLDNTQSATTVGERLANLRLHDQAWRTLRWSHAIKLAVSDDGRMDSKQGLIVITKETFDPQRGVNVVQLPSSARNVALQRWSIKPGREDDPFGQGQIYEVDASQDLLVIRHGMAPAHSFFNVYSLSDGLPHPQAALKQFHISNSGVAGVFRSSTAGAFIRREWVYLHDETFEYYNWKTGERSGEYSKRGALTESVFINDRFIATIVVGMGPSTTVLLVHELPSSNPDIPPLYPTHIAALALFLPEVNYASVDDTEWELVGGSVQSACQSSRASGGDFSTDLNQTLLLIHFRVSDTAYELLVPTQRILELLPHPGDLSMSAGTYSPLDLPWSDWGPRCTHVRPCAPSAGDRTRLQASVFGMRHVLHHPVEWDGKIVVRVNDYQPSRVRRAEDNQTPSCTVRHVHVAEGEWSSTGEMQTELPYVETNIELPESWRENELENVLVSINEDGILLIDVSYGSLL